ncbi:MAG: rubrerythrin family protein, partial [Thaumarchaeota archaeon]|nr:rubrerythrin family protein [Candidatus Calditenuaceae archaeon]MDW8186933.1 rubrerythrin family protein [Nitrososphaerota archaeon]
MSEGFKTSEQLVAEDAEFFSKDEYFDHVVYRELARMEKNGPRRELLERLSEMEDKHYRFWSGYAKATQVRELRLQLFFILLLRRLMGIVFVIKLLERHESEVVARYRRVLERLDGDLREKVEEFLRDEEVHERSLMSQLDEPLLKYIGFVALGLSD